MNEYVIFSKKPKTQKPKNQENQKQKEKEKHLLLFVLIDCLLLLKFVFTLSPDAHHCKYARIRVVEEQWSTMSADHAHMRSTSWLIVCFSSLKQGGVADTQDPCFSLSLIMEGLPGICQS